MASGMRVRGITIELDADITKLSKSFKEAKAEATRLQSNITAISKYIQTDNSWGALGNKISATSLQQKMMKEETEQLQKKLEAEKQALEEVKKADPTGELTERQMALQTQIALDTEELYKLQKAYRDLSDAQITLNAIGEALQGTGDKLKGLGDSMTSVGKTLSLHVTTPIVGVGTAAIKSSTDFESAMKKVQSVTIGATAEQMEQLSAAVLDMSGKSKYSASEAAEALYYMGLAGWNVDEMLEALPSVLSVATAGEMDLGRASDIVTDYFTAFGNGAGTVEHMVDVMAKTMVNSNTDIDQLGEAFKYVAPVAGSLGYSIDDVSMALGLMANNGIKGSQAGTSLRQFMQRLAKPTDEVTGAMKELGLSLEKDDGTMKSFREVMDDLRRSFGDSKIPVKDLMKRIGDLDEALQNGEISEEEYSEAMEDVAKSAYGVKGAENAKNAAILAGVRGMSGLLAIVNTTEEEYIGLSDAISGTTTAQDIANVMMDTTEGKTLVLKHSVQNLGISIGESLLPKINEGIVRVQGLVEKFAALDAEKQNTILTFAGIAAAAGPVLIVAGSLVSSIGSIIGTLGSMVSFFATNPIALGVTALGLAIGGLVIHINNAKKAEEEEREALYGLSEEHKTLLENIENSASAYEKETEARENAAASINTEVGYYENLQEELGRLVDENGRIKEGYEERVSFILGELNNGIGLEYSLNEKLIEDYQQMQSEISNLIEKKREELIINQGYEKYKQAIQDQQGAYEAYSEASAALEEQQKKTAQAQAELDEYTEQYADMMPGMREIVLAYDDEYQKLNADLQTSKDAESKLEQAVTDSKKAYNRTQNDIENYGNAMQAVASGDTKAARDALNKLLNDFKNFDTATEQELRDQVEQYNRLYEQAQKDIEAGVAGVSQTTVDGYAEMARLAQIELDKFNGKVSDSMDEAIRTTSEKSPQIAESTRTGLESVDMTGPGSEHIKQYIGGEASMAGEVEAQAKASAERTKIGLTLTSMNGPGSEHMSEYISGMEGRGSDVTSAALTLANGAKKMFESIDTEECGGNFSLGVAKGIRKYIYTVEEAAQEVGSAGKKSFNKYMAINSPSRVMEDSGEYFDLGIAVGIKRNRGKVMEEALMLASELAGAMTYDTTSPNYGIASGGGTVNRATTFQLGAMNISIQQQPGQDAQELVDVIVDNVYQDISQRLAVMGV